MYGIFQPSFPTRSITAITINIITLYAGIISHTNLHTIGRRCGWVGKESGHASQEKEDPGPPQLRELPIHVGAKNLGREYVDVEDKRDVPSQRQFKTSAYKSRMPIAKAGRQYSGGSGHFAVSSGRRCRRLRCCKYRTLAFIREHYSLHRPACSSCDTLGRPAGK